MMFPRGIRFSNGWILLGLACLAYGVPTAWRLGRSDSCYHMEQMSLLPSQETWLRMHDGEPGAWKTPSLHGQARIRKPPLVVWVNLWAWRDLTPENSTVNQRIDRARRVAASLGLLGILSTFALGRLLYGPRAGGLAALLLASMYVSIKQGRMASFDTHLMGWIPLAVFATLAAADLTSGRRRWAWLPLASLAATAAIFTKGPVALVCLVPPLALAPFFFGEKRFRSLALALPILLAGGIYAVWVRRILAEVPHAEAILWHEMIQDRDEAQPFYYYLIVLVLIFPWTLLFAREIPRQFALPRPLRYPLVVLGLGLLLFSVAEAKRQRYLMPLLPFAALAMAVAWKDPAGTEKAPHPLEWMHAGLLTLVSLILPLFLPLQTRMVEWGWLRAVDLPGAGLDDAVWAMAWLWPASGWLLRATHRRQRESVILATALWISFSYAFAMHFYVDSFHGQYEHQDLADALRGIVGEKPLWLAVRGDRDSVRPDDKFYFHAALRIPPRDLEDGSLHGFALVPESHLPAPDGWKPIQGIDEGRRFLLFRIP